MAQINAFFSMLHEYGGSDLHLSSGSQPLLRLRGPRTRIKYKAREHEELQRMLDELTPEAKGKAEAVKLAGLAAADEIRGRGLAETTPGPLIMVTQFVGFLTAWHSPGGLDPLLAGVLGGLLTTFGMFLPSFGLVLAGAPYVEPLTANPRLRAALTGISAAVVGVVLKLGVVFATATFLPAGRGVDAFAAAVALASGLALWRWNTAVHLLVLAAGAAGAAWTLLGPVPG